MQGTQPVIATLGAGSWGTALAILLSRNGAIVRLWGHLRDEIEKLRRDRENLDYLPGIPFPPQLLPTVELEAALDGVDAILVAVPSHAFRTVLSVIKPLLQAETPLFWATKGLDPQSDLLLHEVAEEVIGDRPYAVVSGPSFAKEVAQGLPTAITVASRTSSFAEQVAGYLHSDCFRAYTSDDVVGVEVGGAAKNVMAIGAGISDGLGFGANSRAALITRGMAEITRLGVALGGRSETFTGLAGIGDLVLTCTDDQSRNRRMGLALARGLSIEAAKREIGQEVEGVVAAREVYHRSRKLGVEMPITEQIYRVLYEGLDPKEAVQQLLDRQMRAETG